MRKIGWFLISFPFIVIYFVIWWATGLWYFPLLIYGIVVTLLGILLAGIYLTR